MPQLDPSSFASQLFWLIISFFILLLLMQNLIIPRMKLVFESRLSSFRSSLRTAERMKLEAEEIENDYSSKLSRARKMIVLKLSETSNELSVLTLKQISDAEENFKKMLRKSERDIAKFKADAKGELEETICSSVKTIVKELVGVELQDIEIKTIIEKQKGL